MAPLPEQRLETPEHMISKGLACFWLRAAAGGARRTGARLTLLNCPPIVPRMLALLRLEDALEIQVHRGFA